MSNKPQAFIAVNNNRLKQYGNTVYLKDGTDFQIELDNPTKDRYLAKIKHQGRKESSGLILRPGEHVYLERFLDEDRKLTFETYEIPQKNLEKAEEYNGEIVITFHKEKPQKPQILGNDPFDNLQRIGGDKGYYDQQPNQPRKWGGNSGGLAYYGSGNNITFSTSNSAGNDSISYCQVENVTPTASKDLKAETGRIEKGEKSDQSFDEGHGDFSAYARKTVTLKIRPQSRKPQTAPIRKYCSECGSKVKKKWKYCVHCGEKL